MPARGERLGQDRPCAPGSFFSWTTNWFAMTTPPAATGLADSSRGTPPAAGRMHLLPSRAMTTPIELPPAVAAALEAPDPASGSGVEAAGIPFSALTWGDRPTGRCCCMHGVTSSAEIWWRIGPALAATGRRVVAPDLPGHGQTGHWMGHDRFRDNARGPRRLRPRRPGSCATTSRSSATAGAR